MKTKKCQRNRLNIVMYFLSNIIPITHFYFILKTESPKCWQSSTETKAYLETFNKVIEPRIQTELL